MLTNTYPPVVSGVARSIVAFEREYRRRGHEVRVIAPEADDFSDDQANVVRVPAIQHFNGSQFPLPVPSPGLVAAEVDAFGPDIVHAHHPFFMGSTAVRLARSREVPLVFTHHTMWDHYTHYAAAADLPAASRFVGALVAGYANLCDAIIAPSRSVADLLRERGVERRMEIIPMGVDVERFSRGNGRQFRRQHNIPEAARVIGYVGRLAPEKNLEFLSAAVARYLAFDPGSHFLVVGSGPSEEEVRNTLADAGAADRLHLAGLCEEQELIDAYHAMDLFAFASQTETQGMVLTEAMAAGKPVVALDGPGVRDVVRDRVNGRLVSVEHRQVFAQAVAWMFSRPVRQRVALRSAAHRTAEHFSMSRQAGRALALYESLVTRSLAQRDDSSPWARARGRIEAEWELLSNVAQAATRAMEAEESRLR